MPINNNSLFSVKFYYLKVQKSAQSDLIWPRKKQFEKVTDRVQSIEYRQTDFDSQSRCIQTFRQNFLNKKISNYRQNLAQLFQKIETKPGYFSPNFWKIPGDQFQMCFSIKLSLALPVQLRPSFFGML